jgi:hypothetical protein
MRSKSEPTPGGHSQKPTASGPQASPQRRHVLAGLGAAGAAGVALTALPLARQAETTVAAAAPEAAPDAGGGYRLSEHVRRYYQTTRV